MTAPPTPPRFRIAHDTIERAVRFSRLNLPRPIFDDGQGDVQATGASESTPWTATSASLVVLATLAVFYTLYVARTVLLPVALALLLGFLLRPFVRLLRVKLGIREPFGAAIAVLSFTIGIATSGYLLIAPATSWLERAPSAMADLERKASALSRRFLKLEATAARVEAITSGTAPSARRAPEAPPSPRTPLLRRFAGGVFGFLTMAFTVVFLGYFLLASGDLFIRKMTRVLSGGDSSLPREISNQVEASVSRYLLTVAAINLGLGLTTWALLQVLGMPNAGLWGTVAGLMNFVPYVGALITTAILTVASMTAFDTFGRALAIPAAYLVLNLIESNVVTPLLMGRRFPLNPVALFVGILFWGFIWGVVGAILAVPMMVTLKIVCDQIPTLKPIGEFLGQ
ncbi:MAG: AI-2E family transporter [Gemmatimonadota bacterium]